MQYDVANEAAIVAALRNVLRPAKTILSQRRLGELVLAELRRVAPHAAAAPDRVRRIAAVQPFVRLELRARKGPKEKVLNRCPVCGNPLQRLKNQTLFGGEVTLTLRCERCSYWTGKEKRVPTLYMFHYRGPHEAAEPTHADKPF